MPNNLQNDDYKEFSNLLSELVESFENNKKKEELEKILLKMDFFAERMDVEVMKEFIKLKQLLVDKKLSKQVFLNQCLKLKNELWEL